MKKIIYSFLLLVCVCVVVPSCGTITKLQFQSDSVHMYNPNFNYTDSTALKL